MLTLKNICKTYHTKGGVDVKALDDVSLTFPETGMVFILGKSGSGKSTLLNVCGGLDSADSGEIIICGRSSSTFTGSDFDSYRNTFVGFIFQEYNILNEFTVEENLALALELQGKGKNREKVAELLRQVDLEGFAKRKPNTLSGGQKQRIAIARALIKEPKIIMADEPTGALDSNTGRQVLDTLKKLSETRLVIVVSHDREFAEVYGDRVIELKDGKVISDVSKKSFAAEKMGENISVIASETLSVKSGKNLSESDMQKIRDYIAEADGDIIISRSKNDITSFKKVNRIAEDDSSEHFEITDGAAIPTRDYTAAESALVRSKLPVGKAIKMGASSLKVKKFRLFLTIFLSVIAFIMFGIFSTLMTYDGDNVLINSYSQSDYDVVPVTKMYNVNRKVYNYGELTDEYTTYYSTYFSDEDIAELNAQLGGTVTGIFQLSDGSASPLNVSASSGASRALYDTSITGAGCASEASGYRKMLAGTYPAANDEIAISYWYYNLLKTQTFYSVTPSNSKPELDVEKEITTVDDVIGQYLCFEIYRTTTNYAYYKITGVYDGGEIPAAYDGWDDPAKCAAWDSDTLYSYRLYISESMHDVLLVCDTFCDNFIQTYGSTASVSTYNYNKYFSAVDDLYSKETNVYIYYASVYDSSDEDALAVHWLGEEKTSLEGNEVILDSTNFSYFLYYSTYDIKDSVSEQWAQKYSEKYADALKVASQYADEYYTLYWQEMNKETPDTEKADEYYDLYDYYNNVALAYNSLTVISNVRTFAHYVTNPNSYTLYIDKDIYEEAILDYVQNYNTVSLTVTMYDLDDMPAQYTIVGYHDAPSGSYYNGSYVSQTLYDSLNQPMYYSVSTTNYVLPDDAIYSYAYISYDGSENLISKIVGLTEDVNADDSFISISSTLYSEISTINTLVDILGHVFLYAGLALALFAALLLFNFISVSITNKTHEIGVLRAVGARGWDVFKIFFAEAAIITLICLVISIIGTLILVSYLNSVLSAGLGFPYVLFSFGIVSLLMMLGVAAVVAVLGTFIPVFRISRKKPVDSMRT